MRKERLRKVAVQFLLFDIRMTQEISKGDVGNGKWLVMANYIYFKNNFNLLVMNIAEFFLTNKMCI